MEHQDDLVDYYRRELAYLRESGESFSHRYPKVAQRLNFSDAESKDPHTERLIESFAFLTGRIQREIDREFPLATTAVLENLCPHLTQPVPSMGVAQMTLDPSQGKVMAGLKVQAGTSLQAAPINGQVCRFQTAWDTDLWPLAIAATFLEDSRVLCLKFVTYAGVDLSELDLDVMRLHISGDLMTAMPLHDLLASNLERIELWHTDNSAVHRLPLSQWYPVGYAQDEQVLPLINNLNPAYSFLQEYFVFPRKFLFFDLKGLKGLMGRGGEFTLKFMFKSAARALSAVTKSTLRLGCVPIVNLFQRTTEPITLAHRQHEYLLVADYQREVSHEIHSIEAVIASDPDASKPVQVPNVFAVDHLFDVQGAMTWSSRREVSLRKDIGGTDTYISFIDRSPLTDASRYPVMFAKVNCTNRHLAEHLPPGARLMGEAISSNITLINLYEPSMQRNPVSTVESIFSLLEILRLNHHSLIDGSDALEKLHRLLMLFAGETARNQSQIRGLKSIRVKPSIARIGRDTWRGHCIGNDIWLDFEESAFVGGSTLIFAGVLSRFFALYTTANSYTRVGVMRNGEVWRQWPPYAGWQCLI